MKKETQIEKALRQVDTAYRPIVINGKTFEKETAKKLLIFGIKKGYSTVKEINQNDIDKSV